MDGVQPGLNALRPEAEVERLRIALRRLEVHVDDLESELELAKHESIIMQDATSEAEAYAEALVAIARSGLMKVTSDGRLIEASERIGDLLGVTRRAILGDRLTDLVTFTGDTPADGRALVDALCREGQRATLRRHDRADGDVEVKVELKAEPIAGGDDPLFLVVARDLSTERELSGLAEENEAIDPLTGLATRQWAQKFFDALECSPDAQVCIVYANMDQFERVNDAGGFAAGDEALRQLGSRLQTGLGNWQEQGECLAVRMGGDEFLLLVASEGADLGPDEIASAVDDCLSAPVESAGTVAPISASVGFTSSAVGVAGFDRLVNEAQIAMRAAKSEGGWRIRGYDRALGYKAVGRLTLEERIREGIDKGEFRAYFQPKVDTSTGDIVGAEALVRWHKPGVGVLPPGRFLRTAERSQLIDRLDQSILDQTLAVQQAAMEMGAAVPIAINTSERGLFAPDFSANLARRCEEAGVPPSLVAIEISESVMSRGGELSRAIDALDRAGFQISIDDFGVEHSSIARLREARIREVKVDRSFVKAIPGDVVDTEILRALVMLAGAGNCRVVVEGVERSEQLDSLREMGPCLVQGFLYSPAVSAEQHLHLLEKQPWHVEPTVDAGSLRRVG